VKFNECKIGFGITGSFCTFGRVKNELEKMAEAGADITPVFSFNTQITNTRFADAGKFVNEIEKICGKAGMKTIAQAEPVGPKALFDVMVIAPCTGNTLAKLCAGITDSPVLMAAKAHLRNERPLVISVSTNDALGINFKNIGYLMNMKNVYFVPFGQDDPVKKPKSMIGDMSKIPDAVEAALEGRQLQPVISNKK
jgi:dipicolinic acid synthetase, B subunit